MKNTKSKEKVEVKGLGALANPVDTRDISLARVQAPVALPRSYKTDIAKLTRRDQKATGSCVGQAGAALVDFFNLLEEGKSADAAARGLYALCKARDGLKAEGTYPRVLAKVLTDIGAPTTKHVKEDFTLRESALIDVPETKELLADAYPFRVDTNYAWVAEDVESLKQAIYQNKVILASLLVGDDKSDGRMTAVNPRGRHYILLFGFETRSNGDTKFLFLNSWGKDWGKNGEGYFYFSDMVGKIYDVLAFVDIPNEILQEAKTTYKFQNTLKPGSVGPEVLELQNRLANEKAKDGLPCFRNATPAPNYGPATRAAVERYQCAKGIICYGTPETTGYGQLGPSTRAALNASTPEKVLLYPKVAEMRDKLVTIMEAVGYPIVVTDEYRSYEAQDALYAQGRSKPGNVVTNAKGGESYHNFRCAFDVAFKKGTGITYDGDFDMLGKVGKALGLEWGGDWSSFVDRPHFQFTAGYSLADFRLGAIDESKFGVAAKAADITDNNSNMTILHRVKSLLITAGSLVGTAIVTVAITNPAALADVLAVVNGYIANLGLPTAFVFFIGLVVNEIVRAVLNARKVAKAYEEDVTAAFSRGSMPARKQIELY